MEKLPDLTMILPEDAEKNCFADAAVSAKTPETRKEIIQLQQRIGFRRFCINTEVDSIWTPNTGKKKKKGEERDSPQPNSLVPHPSKTMLSQEGCRVYSRLTFPLTDAIQLNRMSAGHVLAYDVIAVEPANEKLFHKVCTEAENVDVVTFNYNNTNNNNNNDRGTAPPYKIQPGIVKVAQERGIHFEINVSPGLRSSANCKQNLISYARKIVAATKGKNVLLSCGALKPSEVRGPYDLMNLGVLFGMNQSQAKDAVTKNFDAVLRHSLSRQSGGGVVTFARQIHCGEKTQRSLAGLRKLKAVIAGEAESERRKEEQQQQQQQHPEEQQQQHPEEQQQQHPEEQQPQLQQKQQQQDPQLPTPPTLSNSSSQKTIDKRKAADDDVIGNSVKKKACVAGTLS